LKQNSSCGNARFTVVGLSADESRLGLVGRFASKKGSKTVDSRTTCLAH
jgi:hypothetical protein